MNHKRSTCYLAFFMPLPFCLCAVSACMSAELELRKGDTICLVGNALGERLQHYNHWERDPYERYPDWTSCPVSLG
jgi:hypothetical protein